MVGGLIGPTSQQQNGELAMSLIDVELAQKLASRAFVQKSSGGLTA